MGHGLLHLRGQGTDVLKLLVSETRRLKRSPSSRQDALPSQRRSGNSGHSLLPTGFLSIDHLTVFVPGHY